MTTFFALQLLVLIAMPALVRTASNGMDMSMDGAMDLASGNMISYLHFTPGDTLWFQGWVPSTSGAMVGACIGLFMLAILERWVACLRTVAEMAFWKSAQRALSDKLNNPSLSTPESQKSSRVSVPSLPTIPVFGSARTVPPFLWMNDIPRGIMYAAQSAIGFLFMLAVMTFQVGFILSIVVGLGVGETLFGRYANLNAHLL